MSAANESEPDTLAWAMKTLGITPRKLQEIERHGGIEPAGNGAWPAGVPCTCAYCANARALAWARSPAGTPYGAGERGPHV